MTLRSALQDLRETSLAALSGLLARLSYLGSLRRREGGYHHWGLSLIHGENSSESALKTAHTEVLGKVLRAPISQLKEDLKQSSAASKDEPGPYIEALQEQGSALLPVPQDAVSAKHLNSILVALSRLEKNRKPATPSAS